MRALIDMMFDPTGLTPHGFCLAWDPRLLWLHVVGNTAIAGAYFSIPLALAYFVRRRRDVAFPWVFWLFAAFILACGTTHVMSVATLWLPLYWLDGVVMLVTGAVSVVTATALWPLLPRALALPSPEQFREANRALVREIAERDALQARLRESEALFRAFFEHAPDLVAVLRVADSAEPRFEAVNPALGALLDRPSGAILGRSPDAVIAGDAGQAIRAQALACIERGQPVRFETRIRGADRRERIFEAVLAPVAEPGDAGTRVMASLRDVTERTMLEQQLVHSQKMEALGRMTGGVAHDFNNILMGLSGALQRILHEQPLDSRRAAIGAAALQSVERGARLIRHMLAFARRQPLDPEAVDAGELVRVLAEDVVSRTLGGDVGVEVRVDPAAAPVLVDRTQLEAALLNLAVNARDAMPQGGRLLLEVGNAELDAERAAPMELPAGTYVRVAVTDTGTGMAPEVAAQAFDPFFTTKPVGEGTGLGLSQVYGFARQSGGGAEIVSAPGQGATVAMYLPRFEPSENASTSEARDAPLPAAREPAAPAPSGDPKHGAFGEPFGGALGTT